MYSANYHKIWCKDGTLDYHQNLKISSMTKVHYIEFRLGLRLQLRLGGLIILRIEGCVLLSIGSLGGDMRSTECHSNSV